MWYIMENTRFFLFNVIATTLILTGLTFGIPPLINWLTDKLHLDSHDEHAEVEEPSRSGAEGPRLARTEEVEAMISIGDHKQN